MAVQTLPVSLDMTVYAGATFRRVFRWLPDGILGQDFTGWSGTVLLGPAHGEAVCTLTVGNGGVVLAEDGTITVTIDAQDTALLPSGVLAYQLDLTSSDAETVVRLLRGRVSVVYDVLAAA